MDGQGAFDDDVSEEGSPETPDSVVGLTTHWCPCLEVIGNMGV